MRLHKLVLFAAIALAGCATTPIGGELVEVRYQPDDLVGKTTPSNPECSDSKPIDASIMQWTCKSRAQIEKENALAEEVMGVRTFAS